LKVTEENEDKVDEPAGYDPAPRAIPVPAKMSGGSSVPWPWIDSRVSNSTGRVVRPSSLVVHQDSGAHFPEVPPQIEDSFLRRFKNTSNLWKFILLCTVKYPIFIQ